MKKLHRKLKANEYLSRHGARIAASHKQRHDSIRRVAVETSPGIWALKEVKS